MVEMMILWTLQCRRDKIISLMLEHNCGRFQCRWLNLLSIDKGCNLLVDHLIIASSPPYLADKCSCAHPRLVLLRSPSCRTCTHKIGHGQNPHQIHPIEKFLRWRILIIFSFIFNYLHYCNYFSITQTMLLTNLMIRMGLVANYIQIRVKEVGDIFGGLWTRNS